MILFRKMNILTNSRVGTWEVRYHNYSNRVIFAIYLRGDVSQLVFGFIIHYMHEYTAYG